MYVQPIQTGPCKICPYKNPHIVLINTTISAVGPPSQLPAGVIKFAHRLENIIGFKVDHFDMTDPTANTPSTPINLGNVRTLSSSYLGGLVKKNLFYTAISHNTSFPTIVPSEAVTDIIAYSVKSTLNAGSGNIYSVDPYFGNAIKMFARPIAIEGFDWTISNLSGPIVPSQNYASEIVIHFYEACDCTNSSYY